MKLCAVIVIVVLGARVFAGDVAVTVVSADGIILRSDTHEPIPGAKVRLTPRSPVDGEETLGWETTTDGSGRFVLPAVPARRIFAVTVRGSALALHRPIDLFATGHSVRHFPPIEVPPSVPHAGIVRDHEGEPLAGAAIELLVRRNLGPPNALSGFSGGGSFELVHETASDSEGRFTVWRSVTEPEGILRAELPKYAPALELLRASRKERIEIRLERAVSLSGRVIDTWGAPVAGARASARPRLVACRQWIDLLERRAISGPDGGFVISALLPGESYNVLGDKTEKGFVWEAGRDDARKPLVLAFSDAAPERSEAHADTTARFTGKVLDAKADAPIDGAQVELWPAGHGKHSEIGTATDTQGLFELFQLPPGHEFLLTVRAPGYRPAFDDIRIPDAGLTKDYKLEPAPAPRIHCRDLAGKALANVPVALFIGGSDLSHLYARAITDLTGECALHGTMEKQITRGVDFFDRNAGCCVTAVPRAQEGSRFSFEVAPARIRGTVTDARGNRIEGASVRIWQDIAFTDRDGAFEVPVAPTGRCGRPRR
jgi:protocatechuate 3,4-dioxygenase beta subunit